MFHRNETKESYVEEWVIGRRKRGKQEKGGRSNAKKNKERS
jgi:hypothetical protein